MSFSLLLNSKEDILNNVGIARQLTAPIDIHNKVLKNEVE